MRQGPDPGVGLRSHLLLTWEVLEMISFNLGPEEYGVEITALVEVVEGERLVPVPRVAPSIVGSLKWKGRLVPVIDLKKEFSIATPGLKGEPAGVGPQERTTSFKPDPTGSPEERSPAESTRIGSREERSPVAPTVVVVNVRGEEVGLLVDEAGGVVRFTPDMILPVPPIFNPRQMEYLMGLGVSGDRLVIIIDLERILDAERFEGLGRDLSVDG